MVTFDVEALRAEVKVLRSKIVKHVAGRDHIGEEDTKATLINPLLKALGWDVWNLDQVRYEYKFKKQDKPVDYALLIEGEPRLFLEAKALGENLENRKLIFQIAGYAVAAGVEWCVLTDGDEYRLYNTLAKLPLDRRLFRKVSIADDAAEDYTVETLGYLCRPTLMEDPPILTRAWIRERADRDVRDALRKVVEEGSIKLAHLLKNNAPGLKGLKTADIRESLRRAKLELRFEAGPQVRRGKEAGAPPLRPRVTLSDLINKGILRPPVKLVKNYKGATFHATVLPDGKVEFQGVRYKSLSTAAERAAETLSGRRRAQDGWFFWKIEDPQTGELKYLEKLRQEFRRRPGGQR